MAKTISIQHEAADFGDPPAYLAQWEVLLGGARYVKVYLKLRDGIRDGKTITLRQLGDLVGISANAVDQVLNGLADYGFIALDDESSITRVIVRDAPFPPDGTEEYISANEADAKQNERDNAQVFIGYWNQLHRHYLLKPYDVVAGRDAAIAKRILKNVGMARAKKEMRWYWSNRNEDDASDIGTFSVNYNDISRDRAESERRSI